MSQQHTTPPPKYRGRWGYNPKPRRFEWFYALRYTVLSPFSRITRRSDSEGGRYYSHEKSAWQTVYSRLGLGLIGLGIIGILELVKYFRHAH